ncbi:MAG: cytidylate kinase-like family protein [Anaerolineales bacterium]|nr:MAG: cytidylate kinase-like family protein [Anaerolineales bacterium]
MGAITISRQMGSRGDELALQVAQRLGWRRVCRDLINQAALAAGVPQVALAEIDELGFLGLRPSTKEWQAYQSQVKRIIRDLADQGDVVIVGRGSQMVLRGRPDVLHVRVVAPFEARVAQLQEERQVSAESACACLEASDKARTRYLRRSHAARLNDPTLYHLTLNTGFLSLSQAVDLIIQAFQAWVGLPSDALKST